MNKERLPNVAKALRESKAPENFDMDLEIHVDCGSPACAWGHYASRPDLQNAWKIAKPFARSCFEVICIADGHPASFCDRGVLTHFDITDDEHHLLFDHDGCGGALTPVEAAEYIERFVREHEDGAA